MYMISMRFMRCLPVLAALLLSACSGSYIVLLPDDEGKVGKVVVSTEAGQTLLDGKNQGTVIGAQPGKTKVYDEQKIASDFSAAIAAVPRKPVSFLLYFELGSTELTPASQAVLPKVLAEIKGRTAPDVSVIGHTDTTGNAAINEQVSLQRARYVAGLIGNQIIRADRMTVTSHGEKNLLIPTPDNTPEERNRRVEVTVR